MKALYLIAALILLGCSEPKQPKIMTQADSLMTADSVNLPPAHYRLKCSEAGNWVVLWNNKYLNKDHHLECEIYPWCVYKSKAEAIRTANAHWILWKKAQSEKKPAFIDTRFPESNFQICEP